MLEALPAGQRSTDAAVLIGLAWMKLQHGEVQEGVSLCRRAVQQRPLSADYAMKLGIALTRSGDLIEAERQLNRAIDLDPSLAQAYLALAMLYDSQKRTREMTGTLERYLKWSPQNIVFRLQKARSTGMVRP
jgi:Flp pilus assembly protein TadD